MTKNTDVPQAVILTLPRDDTVLTNPDLEVMYQTGYGKNYSLELIKKGTEEYFLIKNKFMLSMSRNLDYEFIKFYSFYNAFSYLFFEKYPKLINTNIQQLCLSSCFFSHETLNYELMSLTFNMKRIIDNIIQYDCYIRNNNTKIESIGQLLKSQSIREKNKDKEETINFQDQHIEHTQFLKLLNRLHNSHKHDLFLTHNIPYVSQNTDRVFAIESVNEKDLYNLYKTFFNLDCNGEKVIKKINDVFNARDFILLEYNISLEQLMISFYFYIESLLLKRLKEKFQLV